MKMRTTIENLSPLDEKMLKSILVSHAKEGATVEDIRKDFMEQCGEMPDVLRADFSVIKQCLQSIKGVHCVIDANSCYLWYSSSAQSRHISKMVENQKPPRNSNYASGMKRKQFHRSAQSCYFKDNDRYQYRRQYMSEPSLSNSSNNRSNTSRDSGNNGYRNNYPGGGTRYAFSRPSKPAYFYEHQLVGDDFLMALAVSDLKCTAERNRNNILRSGLCVSGQTIRDATAQVLSLATPIDENVIVNIGSVDLLHGTEYVDMKNDFVALYDAFLYRRIQPVITTLAPLANQRHNPQTVKTWRRFNQFLKDHFPCVVDICPNFMTVSKEHILPDCFQRSAVYVTGSCQPHLLWSRVGRQRILGFLKREVSDLYDTIER